MGCNTKPSHIAFSMSLFGLLSFAFGVFAELKKPLAGIAIPGVNSTTCLFPNDHTIAFGALSVLAVIICAGLGLMSVFFPYKGKSVPKNCLLESSNLYWFFVLAVFMTIIGIATMSWATITEVSHRVHKVHPAGNECATAKTGLFGGGAFLTLDAMLFWLVSQMLALNAREDYLSEDDDDDEINKSKGGYGGVITNEF